MVEYEVYYNTKNNQLLQKVAKDLGDDSGGVPFLVIGDEAVVGFAEGVTSGVIEQMVGKCLEVGCVDVVAEVINPGTSEVGVVIEKKGVAEDWKVDKLKQGLLVGGVRLSSLSLPLLTVVMAAADGFNPCAMWTLLFLISLLVGMKDRKRMWILGTVFVVSSAGVYLLFMTAWLNLFLFLGMVVWIRAVIGLVAVGVGGYYLRDFFVNRTGGCGVMGDEKRQGVFGRLKEITQKKQFVLAVLGIMGLAVAVNMVEMVCSAGLPAIYTKVLSLSELATWQYYTYLLLYILVFMLDDLFVFFTAMITLRAVGIESKYARYSRLVGGILMGLIGLVLLFKPEWLMFG